jgi:hypothetical protein
MSLVDWYLSLFLSLLERVMRTSGFLQIMVVNFLDSDIAFCLYSHEYLIMVMSVKMSCDVNILVRGGVRNRELGMCADIDIECDRLRATARWKSRTLPAQYWMHAENASL